MKKKKSLFWIQIRKRNSFSLGFPYGGKAEPLILQSTLHENIKNDFLNARRYITTRYIAIEVQDHKDLENLKKLIDLKISDWNKQRCYLKKGS
ncbi:MAG: DUF3788 family protein [Bacteroidales bacterium]|nr:DUF3788 family protein [Bacteroidales bacterium]